MVFGLLKAQVDKTIFQLPTINQQIQQQQQQQQHQHQAAQINSQAYLNQTVQLQFLDIKRVNWSNALRILKCYPLRNQVCQFNYLIGRTPEVYTEHKIFGRTDAWI